LTYAACTAVVTQIAYHAKPTIDADISFLTLDEWKAELEVLLDDLVDEDGTVRRANDLRSDAGIAWHKVKLVIETYMAKPSHNRIYRSMPFTLL
jgi:hypothetical protein